MKFKGVLTIACLLLGTTTNVVSGEKWSWGTNTPEEPTPVAPATPSALAAGRELKSDSSKVPLPLPLEPHDKGRSEALTEEGDSDREPRFLGIKQKLCSLGLGVNCLNGGHHSRPNSLPDSSYSHVPIPLPAPVNAAHGAPRPFMVAPQHHIVPSTVVQHVHTHTHIHHGEGVNSGAVSGGSGFKPSHQLPVAIPDPLYRPEVPAYREECQCVHASFCHDYDIVPRKSNNNIIGLIDARTRGSEIVSNATETGKEDKTNVVDEAQTKRETSARRGKVLAQTDDAEDTRVRRDTLEHLEAAGNSSDAQGRRLIYRPGTTGCGAAYVCCRNPLQHQQVTQRFTCGRRHSTGVLGRIKTPQYVRGDTEFGEYPWHVAILKFNDDYVCGGALIDERHILTAAHCISGLNPLEMKIRLGDWDVAGPTEFYTHVESRVDFVSIHPEYYAGNLINDIAIIRMQTYIDFSSYPHISPVCLPDRHLNYEGQRCSSTGWGKDAFGSHGQFQSILKEVDLPLVPHYQCETALRHTRLGASFSLHPGMLCAGGEEGRDTCEGDGGGPLVCSGQDSRAQLAGLVSWGIGCGHPGIPGVYVKVSQYLEWIHTITHAP